MPESKQHLDIPKFKKKINKLSEDAILSLSAALLTNKSLLYLNLDKNQVGNLGCKELISALENNILLQKLSLKDNNLSNDCLADWLKLIKRNATLKVVDLRQNSFDIPLHIEQRINSMPTVTKLMF